MRAITVCVEYDDYLAITLPRNRRFFREYLVVTSCDDKATQELAIQYGCKVFVTNAFYEHGAVFNKGLAIERAFDILDRYGWMTILDADIILPPAFETFKGDYNFLYSPRRIIVSDVKRYLTEGLVEPLPVKSDTEFAGYCQIFCCDAPCLQHIRPWYGTDWQHAGGCDSIFQSHWNDIHKIRPEWNVVHLGKTDKNWTGRWTERLDGKANHPDAADRRHTMFHKVRGHWGKKIL
jgi:hypothetical protein